MPRKTKEEIEVADAIFHNTIAGRAVFSNKFNFIYDNDSGVAISYGKTIGDTPAYDPIGPEEYVIDTDNFDLNKFKNLFNMFANVKEVDDNKHIMPLTDKSNINSLVSMSTIANLILKINNLSLLSNNDFKEFIKYVEMFKIYPTFMIDFSKLNDEVLLTIKNIGTNISLILIISEFNKDIYDKIINQLLTLNIFYALKIILSKNNLNDIKNLLLNVSNNISTSIAHIDPFIDRKEYREIQEICTNRSLTNISLLSCHSIHFNRKNNNISILMQKCSAGTYSAYVKDYKIAPCEFFTTNYVDLNTCKTIHDFWYHPFFKVARKTVIKQKSCNK